jgi:hypothetical protein
MKANNYIPTGISLLRISISVTLLLISVVLCVGDGLAVFCVEPPLNVINNSRLRRGTASACDPSEASRKATSLARANARDALAPFCRGLTQQQVAHVCGLLHGTPATGTHTGRGIQLDGGGQPISTVLPIDNSNPRVCVILSDVTSLTASTTAPAGLDHGFCVFNNFKVTTTTVHSRARCAVECLIPTPPSTE